MKAEWFRLISVSLGNVSELYPEGDEVQALEVWTPPEIWEGLDTETTNAILNDIEAGAGLQDGQRYSADKAAKKRAAWQVVARYCPKKPEAQCREVIRAWVKSGLLVEGTYKDPVSRHDDEGYVYVDDLKRPK